MTWSTIEKQLNSIPGEFPFIRGTNPKSNDWKINQVISTNNIKTANKFAINSLNGGAGCLTFNCSMDAQGYSGIPIQDKDDMLNLLVGINIKDVEDPLQMRKLSNHDTFSFYK